MSPTPRTSTVTIQLYTKHKKTIKDITREYPKMVGAKTVDVTNGIITRDSASQILKGYKVKAVTKTRELTPDAADSSAYGFAQTELMIYYPANNSLLGGALLTLPKQFIRGAKGTFTTWTANPSPFWNPTTGVAMLINPNTLLLEYPI